MADMVEIKSQQMADKNTGYKIPRKIQKRMTEIQIKRTDKKLHFKL